MSKPKVSILCITYNHEKYVAKALDGFLSQETDFEYEILIHDDASTDKTQEIIKEYQKNNPGKITAILREKNLYSQGTRNLMTRYLLPKATGKYIAVCEGDDYWTSSDKLQKQVDFMDKHEDHALCFHRVKVHYDSNDHEDEVFPDPEKQLSLTTKELIRWNFIQTNSVLWRRQNYKDMPNDIIPGDWYLHLFHAKQGKIGFIDEEMSVYRRHPGGIWWNAHKDKKKFWQDYGLIHLRFFSEVEKLFEHDKGLSKEVLNGVYEVYNALVVHGDSERDGLKAALKEYPAFGAEFLMNQYKAIEDKDKRIDQLEDNIEKSVRSLHESEQELDMIKSTRTWQMRNKAVNKIQRIKGKRK